MTCSTDFLPTGTVMVRSYSRVVSSRGCHRSAVPGIHRLQHVIRRVVAYLADLVCVGALLSGLTSLIERYASDLCSPEACQTIYLLFIPE
jgi:hypothetical protein